MEIDLPGTGKRIRRLMRENGYNVNQLQEELHLSCPQPIYRWMRGQVLPSVDHLFAMSRLFHVHMEDLLEEKSCRRVCEISEVEAVHKIWYTEVSLGNKTMGGSRKNAEY